MESKIARAIQIFWKGTSGRRCRKEINRQPPKAEIANARDKAPGDFYRGPVFWMTMVNVNTITFASLHILLYTN